LFLVLPPENVLETQITLTALCCLHERPVNIAFAGKTLLRIASLRPQLSDSLAHGLWAASGRTQHGVTGHLT
jgi:hypothetical protein